MHANRKLPLDVKQDQHSRAAAHWQVSPSEEGRHLLLYFLMVSCGTNGGSRASDTRHKALCLVSRMSIDLRILIASSRGA
jgi:hypothetical protein